MYLCFKAELSYPKKKSNDFFQSLKTGATYTEGTRGRTAELILSCNLMLVSFSFFFFSFYFFARITMDGRFWIHMSVQLNVVGKVTEKGFREEKKKKVLLRAGFEPAT